MRYLLSLLLTLGVGMAAWADDVLYRWVDEQGNVVFSDQPPGSGEPAKPLQLEVPRPDAAEVEAARQRARRWIEESRRYDAARALRRETRAEPVAPGDGAVDIPDRPAFARSAYFATVGVHLTYTFRRGAYEARYRIELLPQRSLPARAHLELEFQDPANPQRPVTVEQPLHRHGREVFEVSSPLFGGWRCGTYWATIRLFKDATKRELLGRHEQIVRSLVDSRYVTTKGDLRRELLEQGHHCTPPR